MQKFNVGDKVALTESSSRNFGHLVKETEFIIETVVPPLHITTPTYYLRGYRWEWAEYHFVLATPKPKRIRKLPDWF